MIIRTLAQAQHLELLLVALCKQKLSGVQLSLAILIALGRSNDFALLDRSRQAVHQARAALREARLIYETRKGVIIDEDRLEGLNKEVAAIPKALQDLLVTSPKLVAATPFDWPKLSLFERERLHETLLEAAALQCAESFKLPLAEVRQHLCQIPEPAQRRRVMAFARLLKAYSAGSQRFIDQGFDFCVDCALILEGGALPKVQDPVALLREWLANSCLATKLTLPAPATSYAASPSPDSAGLEVVQGGTTMPVGRPSDCQATSGAVDTSTGIYSSRLATAPNGTKVPRDLSTGSGNASLGVDTSNCVDGSGLKHVELGPRVPTGLRSDAGKVSSSVDSSAAIDGPCSTTVPDPTKLP